jgi:phosphatidylserine/phosphatidylglycerophosphate/cardiolipin synthase-like enzyme
VQGYSDTAAHDLDEPRRGMTAAAEKGPIHDVSARIRGPAVGHIQEVFNQHWNVADPAANLPVPPALPGPATPNAGDGEFGATLQIVRTSIQAPAPRFQMEKRVSWRRTCGQSLSPGGLSTSRPSS